MSYLSDTMEYFNDLGVYEIALPFLLVFTLVFAVLQKSKILGSNAKNFNLVIALVIGILFVRNQQLVALVNRFLPNVSMFIVIFLMLLLLISIFIKDEYSGWGNAFLAIAGIVSILAIIWSLSVDYISGRYLLPDWLIDLDTRTKSMIILVAVFVLIIWLISRESSGAERGRRDEGGKGIGALMDWVGSQLNPGHGGRRH